MITASRHPTPDDVAGHYNELDGIYRQVWGEHLHHGLWESGREPVDRAVEQLVERVVAELEVSPGDHLCDVGCGYGATARYLAERYGATVLGVTLSSVQQARAATLADGCPSVRIELGDWTANTLPDNAFDGLYSIECLSHVENRPAYFAQIERVLKPGKHAVVTAWLAGAAPTRSQKRCLLEPICDEGQLAGLGSRAETYESIREAGLCCVRYADLSRHVRRTWRVCAERVLWKLCTRPAYRQFVLRRASRNSRFALSVFRILAAYYTGAMRYGLFVLRKPGRYRAGVRCR